VNDIERSTKFYTEGFGMEVTVTRFNGKLVGLTTPGVGDALVLVEGMGAKLECTLRPERDTAFLRDPDGYVIQI
jgi:catechol 2,3-dioxygenase-like lactoylglutathione lyase family enzyme